MTNVDLVRSRGIAIAVIRTSQAAEAAGAHPARRIAAGSADAGAQNSGAIAARSIPGAQAAG